MILRHKSSTYIDFDVVNNNKDSKIKVGDLVGTSKYNKNFAEGYMPNWFE